MPQRRDVMKPRACTMCGGMGPFSRSPSGGRDGLHSRCKTCMSRAARTRKALNPVAHNAKALARSLHWLRSMSPERKAAHLAKRRAAYRRTPRTELAKAQARVRHLEWTTRRLEAGGCTHCRQPATHGPRCEHHWFCMIAYAHGLKPVTQWVPMLKELWADQGGRCAMTGKPLIGGARAGQCGSPETASLDHKIPRSKGGLSTISNLQWVTLSVNSSKADLSIDGFVTMCRDVVAHADNRVVHLRKVP